MQLFHLVYFRNQDEHKLKQTSKGIFVERAPKGVRKKAFYYLCSGTCIGHIYEEYLLRKTRGHRIKVIRTFITELQEKN